MKRLGLVMLLLAMATMLGEWPSPSRRHKQ